MGLRVGDKVKTSYPVDNLTYGFVTRVIENPTDPLFKNKRLVAVFWPDENKEICFLEENLELY